MHQQLIYCRADEIGCTPLLQTYCRSRRWKARKSKATTIGLELLSRETSLLLKVLLATALRASSNSFLLSDTQLDFARSVVVSGGLKTLRPRMW